MTARGNRPEMPEGSRAVGGPYREAEPFPPCEECDRRMRAPRWWTRPSFVRFATLYGLGVAAAAAIIATGASRTSGVLVAAFVLRAASFMVIAMEQSYDRLAGKAGRDTWPWERER